MEIIEKTKTKLDNNPVVTDWTQYQAVPFKVAGTCDDKLKAPWEPILLDGKRPVGTGWTERENTAEVFIADRLRYPHANGIGLRTGKLSVADVDCTDDELTEYINGVMVKCLGEGALYRHGSKGYAALFQNATPICKLVLAFSKDGVTHKVEILGDGQQVAAFGHVPADTKKGVPAFDYKWLDGQSPLNNAFFDLPVVTPEMLVNFLKELSVGLVAKGYAVGKIGEARIAADRTKESWTPSINTDHESHIVKFMDYLKGRDGAIEEGLNHKTGTGGDTHTWVTAATGMNMGLSPEKTYELMLEHWNDKCVPPWEPDDLWYKVMSAFRNGKQKSDSKAPILERAFEAGLGGTDAAGKELPEVIEAKGKEARDWAESILNLLKPYQAQDPTTLPNMAWLYGTSALRGEVGITIATSGVGKTSLQLLFLYDMATASLELEKLHKGPLRAGFISFEDSQDVLERRIEAIRKHYGGADNIFQDRLFVASFLGVAFKLTKLNDDGVIVLNEDAFNLLKKFILENRIDYLCMDPWVHMHDFPENDNGNVANLVARLKRLALETMCFINIVHHTRKVMNGQNETSQEDSRGASSLVNATRVKRIISPMSKSEASKCRVTELERWRYIKIADGNVNHAPRRAGGEWFKKIGVKLGNAQKPENLKAGELPYEQDDIGVVERVDLGVASSLISEAQVEAIRQKVTLTPHREDNRSQTEPKLVDAIAEAMGLKWDDKDARDTIKTIKTRLLAREILIIEDRKDKKREVRKYVVAGPAHRLPEHETEDSASDEDDADDFGI
jgi:hypothetical protein